MDRKLNPILLWRAGHALETGSLGKLTAIGYEFCANSGHWQAVGARTGMARYRGMPPNACTPVCATIQIPLRRA